MKQYLSALTAAIVSLMLSGCVTTSTESSKPSTVAVEIISEPPGARIEINNDYIGDAPLTVNIPQNSNGEFTRNTTIAAMPIRSGNYVQMKRFYVYGSMPSDPIPKRIFFDMRLH